MKEGTAARTLKVKFVKFETISNLSMEIAPHARVS